MTPAVFLDRDNTLVEDPGFIDTPEKLRLMPGAADALRRFRAAGYRVVVVTNQSGVARGLFPEAALEGIHARLRELLRAHGTDVDAIYYCPFLAGPEAVIERYRRDSPLRKPNPGMLLQAGAELGLDLSRSWMIGDRLDDVVAGRRAGCRTILLGDNHHENAHSPAVDRRAATLQEAADIVEQNTGNTGLGPTPAGPASDRQLECLREIRDLLERHTRRGVQADFSILRLGAYLVQMFAIVAAIWAAVPLLDHVYDAAAARFALAGFLQLIALTAMLSERAR